MIVAASVLSLVVDKVGTAIGVVAIVACVGSGIGGCEKNGRFWGWGDTGLLITCVSEEKDEMLESRFRCWVG